MKSRQPYLEGINTSFLLLLVAHVPVLCGVALYFGTGFKLAAVLGLIFVSAPRCFIIRTVHRG